MKVCRYIINIDGIEYESSTYPNDSDIEELISKWAEDSGRFRESDIDSIRVYDDYIIVKTRKDIKIPFEVYTNPIYSKMMEGLEIQERVERSLKDGSIKPSNSFIR
ncbi:hypothetical protein D3C81_1097010 [compost metagenome]